MKFALIIFLGICAFSVQASTLDFDKEIELSALKDFDGFSEILDKVKEIIDKLVNKVTTTLSEIIEKFNNTIAGLVEKAKEAVQKVLDKFNSIRKQIEDKLKELQEQNAITRECVAKHAPEIMETIKDSQDKMQTCMTTAEAKLQTLREKLQPNFDEIREAIGTLANIFMHCANAGNEIQTVMCVLKDAKDFHDSMVTLFDNAVELIQAAKGEGADIIQETTNCIGVAFDEGQEKLNALMAEIEKCIEESSRSSYLLH